MFGCPVLGFIVITSPEGDTNAPEDPKLFKAKPPAA
jgi:hypothetical protein